MKNVYSQVLFKNSIEFLVPVIASRLGDTFFLLALKREGFPGRKK